MSALLPLPVYLLEVAVDCDWSIHGGGVQGYTPRENQSSHGGWDSVNGPVSPRREILRDWTRTYSKYKVSNHSKYMAFRMIDFG
jgi:hypothetical protein